MNTEEMRQRIKHIKDHIGNADITHDKELMLACLLFALSDVADVLDTLVEQQAPDWAERAEAGICPDCGYSGGDHHEGCQSKHLTCGYGYKLATA